MTNKTNVETFFFGDADGQESTDRNEIRELAQEHANRTGKAVVVNVSYKGFVEPYTIVEPAADVFICPTCDACGEVAGCKSCAALNAPNDDAGECCDICKHQKGLTVPAAYDAPTPWGPWAYMCGACFYRLPADLKKMGSKL